jgi:hypothetical protein
MRLPATFLTTILVAAFICMIWFLFLWIRAKSTKLKELNKDRLREFEAGAKKDLVAIKSTITLSPGFSIGGYTLDSSIRESPELKELSDEEYKVLGKKFKKEAIYRAPHITFLRQKWDMLIGTVAGNIYKLHLNGTFPTDEEAYRCNAVTCYSFEKQLGEATGKSFEDHSIHHIWDTHYGNIHLGYIRSGETYNINISATSNKVRTFDRL